MNKKLYTPKKIGIMAMFIAAGLVLQYVESRILISSVPGGKLGLPNIVSITNIFLFGGRNALLIAILRSFLGALLTGGVTAIPYSVSGAFLSTVVMSIMKKYCYPKVSTIGMSIMGAVCHNVAQLSVASLVVASPYIFSYLPFLLILAIVSGSVTGYGARVFLSRLLKVGDMND